MEYQPLTSSNINENIILKEVMDTHGPVSKDFKASYILHFVKKILFLIMVGLRSLENKKLALVITSHLDIDYSMVFASSFMSQTIAHLWIPIVDDPTLWNTAAMENNNTTLASVLKLHTVKNIENILFKALMEEDPWKEKPWCTNLLLGNGSFIAQAKEWVNANEYIFFIGGKDIRWVKTFASKVLKEIHFNPQLTIKMAYVSGNYKVMLVIRQGRICETIDYKDCSAPHSHRIAVEFPEAASLDYSQPQINCFDARSGFSEPIKIVAGYYGAIVVAPPRSATMHCQKTHITMDEFTNEYMDEVLASVAETIKNFAVIYLVDITEVPDFNTMYELYDPSTAMFFFRNKHIMIDLGTGNNNKINWALKDKQEFIDIVETVYRGARKGRGLVIAPKDYSTKYRY
nr:thioredoxin-like protein YLS8 isoform X2 [Ipomoea batatas]